MAQTLWVDKNHPSASDSTTRASNTASSPWLTLGRASWGSTTRSSPDTGQCAQPGDTVRVIEGSYATSQGSGTHNAVTYNPAVSGTAGNPIIFQGVGTVELTYSGGMTGPMIGAIDRHYIEWDTFTISEVTAPVNFDTGAVVIFSLAGEANDVLYTRIERITINGDVNTVPPSNNNHTGIRLNGSRGAILRNNRIRDIINPNGNTINGSGIETYYAHDMLIAHNEISGCGSGIFLKGNYEDIGTPWDPDFDSTVRDNYIHDMDMSNGAGLVMHVQPTKPGNKIYWYRNIVNGCRVGMTIKMLSPDRDPKLGYFINNTIYNVGKGFTITSALPTGAGHVIWNNIFHTCSAHAVGVESGSTPTEAEADFEHNVYYTFNPFAEYGGANRTFAYWQGTLGFDSASPAGTSTTNPLLVDPANGDFHLGGSSPAITAGVDILDLAGGGTSAIIPAGAYITGTETIGIEGVGNPSTHRKVRRLRVRSN